MTRRLIAFTGLARPAAFGVGKWSRIATYGIKRQRQPDGSWSETDFNDRKFSQWLTNFLLMFGGRGRGMGSDCEHQVLYSAVNGAPAENPAYFTGLAWVRKGRVQGLVRLQPDVAPLDPVAESARLRAEHPTTSGNPDGVWAYCAEVTPYGEQKIPGYSQLSPLVSDDEHLEDGTPIGSALLNVSFVNVAHQTGTNFAFSATTGGQMEITPDELRKKLSAFGLPEKADADGLRKALAAYMEGTEDDKAMRGAMAKACAKALGELEIVHSDDDDDQDKNEGKSALSKELAVYRRRLEDSDKQLAALRKRQDEHDLRECIAEGERRSVNADEVRSFFADYGKERTQSWLKRFALKPVSSLGKWPSSPSADTSAGGTTIAMKGGIPVIGGDLAREARKLVADGKAKTIEEAQRLAFRKSPHLYSDDKGAA